MSAIFGVQMDPRTASMPDPCPARKELHMVHGVLGGVSAVLIRVVGFGVRHEGLGFIWAQAVGFRVKGRV